jgi:hypothetical protein
MSVTALSLSHLVTRTVAALAVACTVSIGLVAAPAGAAEETTSEPVPSAADEVEAQGYAAAPGAANEYNGLRFYDVDNMKSRPAGCRMDSQGWCIPHHEKYPNQFAKPIYWMAQEGLTTGTEVVNRFGNKVRMYYPSNALSREAMAAFMYRKAGRPAFTQPGKDFTDVRPGAKFYREISWMKATGLSTGYADGSYQPKGQLSRGAMAAFMYRQAGNPNFTHKGNFTDSSTSQFATAIAWMKASGRSTGYADGTYRPAESITREAMAAFMYRDAGSPYMPTIPPDIVLTAWGCGRDMTTYHRSLGWTKEAAIKHAQKSGCRSWS